MQGKYLYYGCKQNYMTEQILEFIVLLAVLFFIPKTLARFAFPQPFSEILLGIILGPTLLHLFVLDNLIELMGTIGIITLFFIAGFEVDVYGLQKKKQTLVQNIIIHFLFIAIIISVIYALTSYNLIEAILISLALATPSAGFIIASIKSLHLSHYVIDWIEAKVVSMEIFSLFILLVLMKVNEPLSMLGTIFILIIIIYSLPHIIKKFYIIVIQKVHGSDTFFIFVLSIIVAFITHFMGIHYIIGAFVVGLIMSRIELKSGSKSINHEKIWNTFSSFASIFAPFYFFSVGLRINQSFFTFTSIAFAIIIFTAISILRIYITFIHRRWTLREHFKSSFMIATLTSPTLLFTFVIADILITEFAISSTTYTILIFYGLFSAVIPMIAYGIKLSTEEEFA